MKASREDPRVEGEFQPQAAGAHPIVRGFVPRDFPNLEGYVAVTPKPEAEVVLQSPEQDPILTAWQFGLGRALASNTQAHHTRHVRVTSRLHTGLLANRLARAADRLDSFERRARECLRRTAAVRRAQLQHAAGRLPVLSSLLVLPSESRVRSTR